MNLYVVTVRSKEPSEHLVEARNLNQARVILTEQLIEVRKASHDDIIAMTKAGVEVIRARMPDGSAPEQEDY